MSDYNNINDEIIISGDFNFQINTPDCEKANKLNGILSLCILIQHIMEPTHEKDNTLDLLITRQNSLICKDFVDTQISENNCIHFRLD